MPMAGDGLLLGLDVGTTSAKAVVFDGAGTPLAEGTSGGYPVHRAAGNVAEQDPEDLWHAAVEAIRGALAALGRDAPPIVALGGCGTAPGVVIVRPDGSVERRLVLWQDGRAGAEAAWLAATIGAARLNELLGVRLPVSGSLPTARLVWFQRHRPELLDGAHRFVQPKDYVNHGLTGVWATDITSCLGVMNLRTRRVEPGLLEALRLPAGLLPPAVEPFETIGTVTPAAARATGLPAGIPVVAGWIDAYASKLGTGLGSPGQAFDVAGTAEIVGVAGREPATDLQGLLAIPLYGDLWSVYGLTNTGSDSLRWFVEAFIDRALGGDAFATFEREARAVPAGADGLLFLPYIFGERSPVWDEDVRGLFCGIDRSHGRGHFARAVMEGVGHSVRQLIDRARLVGKAAPDRIRASGGGTRNALVNQIKADITGLPLETLKVNETGALGSAMLAAIGIGLARDYADAVNRMVHADRLYQPDPAKREVYARAHRRYAQLYPAIRGLQEVA